MSGHHHPHRFGWAFFWAIVINAGYIIIEMLYAHQAHSHSLLADAVHNLADVSSLIIAWLAHGLMFCAANASFSYGYKKLTIITSVFNGWLLVSFCVYLGYQAWSQFYQALPMDTETVGWVALLGICINGGTAWLFAHGQDDLNIKGAFLHLLADALISFGVLLGAALQWLSGWTWIDAMVTLVIVVVIVFSTWGLLRDSLKLLLAAVPTHIDHQAVSIYLQSLPGVTSVHDVHIWGISTQEVALTAHLVMPGGALSDQAIRQVNVTLRQRFAINHVTLQVEQGTDPNPCGQMSSCASP